MSRLKAWNKVKSLIIEINRCVSCICQAGSFPVISGKSFDSVEKFLCVLYYNSLVKTYGNTAMKSLINQYEVGESNSHRQLILNKAKS